MTLSKIQAELKENGYIYRPIEDYARILKTLAYAEDIELYRIDISAGGIGEDGTIYGWLRKN
jgi:hypothetical protein